MKKKKIHIVGWKTGDNSFGVTVPYYEFFSQFGEVTILSPGQFVETDLLVLPGGLDVDTARYGEVPSLNTSNSNVILEYFDKNILPKYIDSNTKIFGICRGLQTLNVYFGGNLTQNLIYHEYSSTSRDQRVHELIATDTSMRIKEHFFKRNGKYKVNSLHHQSVDVLGKDLLCMFKSEDGIIEGIMHTEKPIAAVQYHPKVLGLC